MQGRRAVERCCSLFSCHRREWTTCSTCWFGCSGTSGFSSQRKWWGFLAPSSCPSLVSGPALPLGSRLHRRTHREKAAADSASIWTGAVCPTSCWPGQTCTLGWKPSADFWTCTLCRQLQKKNKTNKICAWFMLNDCPDTLDCPLSLLPEMVTVASDSWLLRTSSSLSLSWRLLWFSDFLFHRQWCSAETNNIPINHRQFWPCEDGYYYLIVSLLTRVERYQSSLPLLSPTAFHHVVRDGREGPQTWHDGHFAPGTVRVDFDLLSLQPTAWGSQNSISASTKSPPHPEKDKGPRCEERISRTTWSSLEIIPSIRQVRVISDNSNINRPGSIRIVDAEGSLMWKYCHKQLFFM